jgi:photosystem II stability/assembly factor-like uncharacterized protein
MRAFLFTAVLAAASCTNGATRTSPTPVTSTSSAAPSPPPTPSPKALSTPITLPSIQVAAAGNGVAWLFDAESHLYLSTDRGTTWQERSAPPRPTNGNIAFVDDLNGWAMSAGSPATGCMSQFFQVFRTRDGARTWESVLQDGSPPSGGCKSNIAFSNASQGYISVSSRDGGSWILRTSDAGASWSPSAILDGSVARDPERYPSYVNAPGPAADFGSVLFVSTTTQLGPQVPRSVFRSTERGASWSFVGTPPSAEVTFLTPSRWIAWGSQSSAETTDGGGTWHTFVPDFELAPVVPQIVFGDARTGYAAIGGEIIRTTDGGTHWIAIKKPGM